VAFVPWTGRCGWAGGGVGAQRKRSAGPAMGRSHGTTVRAPLSRPPAHGRRRDEPHAPLL